MKIGIIGEGETEYACLPTLIAKLGHQVVQTFNLGGIPPQWAWEKIFSDKIFPFVRAFLLKSPAGRPDKIIIVLDRDDRGDCCGQLAENGRRVLEQLLAAEPALGPAPAIAVILPNPQFECWLFSQPELLRRSPLFTQPPETLLNDGCMDGKKILNIVGRTLRTGKRWDKVKDGKGLARRLDLNNPAVLQRSRSLRKFVKELPNIDLP